MRGIIVLGTALLVLAAPGCGRAQRAEATVTASPAAAPLAWCRSVPIRTGCRPVVVGTPKQTLRLAVADDDASRERGLMGVKNVPSGQGMIFVFPDGDQTRGFWMKNTVTPLDMLFVTTDGVIQTIAENVAATKPGTPDNRVARRSGIGRYVIELRARGATAAGLEPGNRLTFPIIIAR